MKHFFIILFLSSSLSYAQALQVASFVSYDTWFQDLIQDTLSLPINYGNDDDAHKYTFSGKNVFLQGLRTGLEVTSNYGLDETKFASVFYGMGMSYSYYKKTQPVAKDELGISLLYFSVQSIDLNILVGKSFELSEKSQLRLKTEWGFGVWGKLHASMHDKDSVVFFVPDEVDVPSTFSHHALLFCDYVRKFEVIDVGAGGFLGYKSFQLKENEYVNETGGSGLNMGMTLSITKSL